LIRHAFDRRDAGKARAGKTSDRLGVDAAERVNGKRRACGHETESRDTERRTPGMAERRKSGGEQRRVRV